ncbi:MAG: helix-turn-helix transcriptional regulator [Rhodobacteraceae bacterium]|nr:helix-turn-helix transcriptional regulator [Paracoccaceae bacterium]
MINDFALDLKTARRKSGLSQADCARLMGKSPSRICQLEKGHCTPGLKEICALSLIYGRSFESLFAAIFTDIRRGLRETLTDFPYPQDGKGTGFNRTNTLDRLARDLADNLEERGGA